jgi:uncharacterized membrane protein YvbJ
MEMMKKANQLDAKIRNIPDKGRITTNPRCSKCGTELVEDARYCSACGTSLKNSRSQWRLLWASLVLMFVIIGSLNYLMVSNPGRHVLVLGLGFAFAVILIVAGLALRSLISRE